MEAVGCVLQRTTRASMPRRPSVAERLLDLLEVTDGADRGETEESPERERRYVLIWGASAVPIGCRCQCRDGVSCGASELTPAQPATRDSGTSSAMPSKAAVVNFRVAGAAMFRRCRIGKSM
jgi:hypothetical protein